MTLTYRVEPLTDFTIFKHADCTTRRGVGFTAKWTQTLEDLARELDHLGGHDVVLELAVQPHHVLKDGTLSARTPKNLPHPGVRLSFETRDHGRMSFTCDTYEARWAGQMPNWQANVRAIVLTLKSLRDVGRHGATQGEEYAGFKALPSGSGDGIALGGMTRREAAELIERLAIGDDGERREQSIEIILTETPGARRDSARNAWRVARREAHPDRNEGRRELWDQVEQAAKVLGLA